MVSGRMGCHEKWQFLMVTESPQNQQKQEMGQDGPWEEDEKKGAQGPRAGER